MKLLLVVAVLALAVGASAMSPENRQILSSNNIHNIEILAAEPRKCVEDFLKELELTETFVKLDMPIKGGHSVFYTLREGDAGKIAGIAEKHNLAVVPSRTPCEAKCADCCGRLVLPGGNVVEANVVPGTRAERDGMPKEGLPGGVPAAAEKEAKEAEPVEEKKLEVLKGEKETTAEGPNHGPMMQELKDKNKTHGQPLSAEQKQWYFDNNFAQITKMNVKAQPYLKKFLNDMKENAPNTVLHFMAPVRDGHVIRFTMVEGDEEPISKYATTCGMTLDGDTLTTPGGDVVEAEDNLEDDEAGHPVTGHGEVAPDGKKIPIKFGPLKRGPVPDKWIHAQLAPNTAFLEANDDADALIDTASVDDDSDAL